MLGSAMLHATAATFALPSLSLMVSDTMGLNSGVRIADDELEQQALTLNVLLGESSRQ